MTVINMIVASLVVSAFAGTGEMKALGGNAMYAEKARTMGNALVREQLSTGGIHTYWYDDRFVISDACTEIDWLDCMVDDVEALDELATAF